MARDGKGKASMDFYQSHEHLFGDLDAKWGDLTRARAVIIPAPLEYTVCYGEGTGKGPAAIIAASSQMDLYDEELEAIPAEAGIGTLAELAFADLSHAEALGRIHDAVATVIAHHQLPVTLGGEHSLTAPCVRAIQSAANSAPLGVVQFDAHADLRQEYEDTPISHACAMRRTLEVPGVSLLGVGIRSISPEEMRDRRAGQVTSTIIWAHQFAESYGTASVSGAAAFSAALARLPDRIYITIDLDGLDPGIMPAVGTPEPGGLNWYQLLGMVRQICATKQVVGCDIVELAPIPHLAAPDFLAAKLVYRILGSIFHEERRS